MAKQTTVALGIVIALLVAARLALPFYVQSYVNGVLDGNPKYGGNVGTVHIHLWRGAYEIDNVRIVKKSKSIPVPFFASPRIEFSIDWKALFHAALVGKVTIFGARLNFARGERGESQTGQEGDWVQTVKALFPLRIDRLTVVDSQILYDDFSEDPPLQLRLSQVNGAVKNLTNSLDLSESLVATLQAHAIAEEQAPLYVRATIDPYSEKANFDVALELTQLDLPRLNDVLRSYGGFDAEKGQVGIYTELRARENSFEGYVKVLLRDVHLLSFEKDSSNPLRLIWQGIVAAVAEVFTNQRRDQIATRIPLQGSFENPETDSLSGFFSLVRNAFVRALKPGLERRD